MGLKGGDGLAGISREASFWQRNIQFKGLRWKHGFCVQGNQGCQYGSDKSTDGDTSRK